MHLITRIEAWPRGRSIALGAAFVIAVGYLDYVTGYRLSFSAFYLVPLFVLAWLGGRAAGYLGAVVCTAARTLTDVATGQTFPSLLEPIWNSGMRFVLYFVIVFLLVTMRRHVDHERSIARRDPLTGAANTRAFLETAAAELARSRRYGHPLTLAYFDLDNFKSVNDTRGHAAGDDILRSVASLISATVRSSDLLARLGGDEFALLLPETDEAAARAAVAKVQARFSQEASARSWPIGLSIGTETVPGGAEVGLNDLIARADRRMYEAKQRRKSGA